MHVDTSLLRPFPFSPYTDPLSGMSPSIRYRLILFLTPPVYTLTLF